MPSETRSAPIRYPTLPLLVVLAAYGFLTGCDHREQPQTVTGWPTLALINISTNQPVMIDWQTKAGMVNFWATWCGPCREEMPSIHRLKASLADSAQVLTISVDEDLNLIKEFLLKYNLDLPVYLGESRKVLEKSLKIEAYPVTFIVGRGGKILERAEGAKNWSSPEMLNYFKSLETSRPMPFPETASQ